MSHCKWSSLLVMLGLQYLPGALRQADILESQYTGDTAVVSPIYRLLSARPSRGIVVAAMLHLGLNYAASIIEASGLWMVESWLCRAGHIADPS